MQRIAVQRIAVTGHVNVSDDVARWVAGALTRRLGAVPGHAVHGVTCLARGADQIFARAVLSVSGTFEVLLPARDYGRRMAGTADADTFRELLAQARSVETMPFDTSSRAAYLAASEAMLDRCDLLLAIWDGEPSQRIGDTADVVAKARARALPIEVLWPAGSRRRAAPPGHVATTPVAAPGRD